MPVATMSDTENEDIPMAQCGACGSIIPLDSESCPDCAVRFGGVTEEELGECGGCGSIIPADSESCPDCGVSFIAVEQEDDSTQSEPSEDDSSDEESVDDSHDEESEDDSSDEESEDHSNDEESEVDVEEETTGVENDDEDPEEGTEEDDSEEESTEVVVDKDISVNVVMAFENLALAIAESGMTASEAFVSVDGNKDNLIDAPELQKGIEKISGEKFNPTEVKAILGYLDTDEDNRVNPMELVQALDDLRIGIQPGTFPKAKKKKEFPSNVQKFLMGKKANDIFYPIAYFLMVTFIGLWVVNGLGIIVDGSGGTILYEGDGGVWDHCDSEVGDTLGDDCSGYVNGGELYPCHVTLDENKCQNSYTIFSGENGSDSMPAGFYTDGIFMIILGVIGLGLTAFLHLYYAPLLREKVKGKDSTESSEDSDDELEDNEGEDESDDDDEDESDDDDEDESDDDDDDEEEDAIDIGDWVGIEIDGEEFFGEIIEFDDDEDTVTIETEDGDELTGNQDDMFLEDEDEEDDE